MEKRPMNLRNSQKKCGQELKKLAEYVLPADRRSAMEKFDVSYVTVGRYLQGKAPNLVLGINLLNFFKTAVKNRGRQLGNLINGDPINGDE